MRTESVLIVFREDLIEGCKNIDIESIDFSHIKIESVDKFLNQPMVIFVDNDMETKILKNRYGYMGLVQRKITNPSGFKKDNI